MVILFANVLEAIEHILISMPSIGSIAKNNNTSILKKHCDIFIGFAHSEET
jgi:hypothetical protein